jgi:hypothetical protein
MPEYTDDGWPIVPRFSSALEYLELCKVDSRIDVDILNDFILLTDLGWVMGKNGCITEEGKQVGYTSTIIVEIMRDAHFGVDMDPDLTFIHMMPVNALQVKKEMVDECNDEDEDPAPQVGCRVCEIDLTGIDEEWKETATYDGGHVPQQVHTKLARILRLATTCDAWPCQLC